MSSDPNSQAPRPAFNLPKVALILLVLAVGAVLFTLIGCNPKPNNTTWTGHRNLPPDVVAIFFSKYQGSQSIVADVIRKLPATAKNNPLPFALGELLKGPTSEEKSQGFYSEIPQGTKLLGLSQNNDIITINLSSQFSSGGGSNSMEQRLEELKQTVFSIDSTHQVHLDVEGKPLDLLGGEGLEVPDSLKRQPQ